MALKTYPDQNTDDDGRDSFQDEPWPSNTVIPDETVLTAIASRKDLLDQT